jgi:hypothetical protein
MFPSALASRKIQNPHTSKTEVWAPGYFASGITVRIQKIRCRVPQTGRQLLISRVIGNSKSTWTVTALTRWDEKAGLHGMRYAPRIDVLYAQEKETGDEED